MFKKSPSSWASATAIAFTILFASTAVAQVGSSLNQGIELFETKKYKEAREHFSAMVGQGSEEAFASYYLGRLAFLDSDFETAVRLFEKSIALDAQVSEFHLWLAHAFGERAKRVGKLKALGFARKVKEGFLTAVELDPKSVEACWQLGNFYMVAPALLGGDKRKGKIQIEKLRELDPKLGDFFKAHYHMEQGEYDLAEQEYAKLAKLYPEDPDSYFGLGRVRQVRDQYDKAFEHFDESLRRDPEHRNTLYQYGRTAIFAGVNMERGIECFLSFIEGGNTPGGQSMEDAHWRLGMLYEKTGKPDLARGQYKKALALDPKHKGAKDGLKGL